MQQDTKDQDYIGSFLDGLDQRLDQHRASFMRNHERARAGAGPKLLGSDRDTDYWTFHHVKRAVDYCLADVVHEVTRYAQANDIAAYPIFRACRAPIEAFFDEILIVLEREFGRDAVVNEHGLQPSRTALEGVRMHMQTMIQVADNSVSRGVIDKRLGRPPDAPSPLVAWAGGGDRIVLMVAVLLAVALMWLSF